MKQTINQILLQGLDAQKKGKLYEAEQFYNHILKVHPNHPEANHNLGFIKINNNDLGAAYILFKKAIKANPKIEQFWVSYSNLLIKQKKFEEAANNYKVAMTTIPNSPVIHNNLGGILYTLRRMEESVKNYKKAIEFKPDYAETYNNLGNVLNQLERLEEAELSYRKAIELNPENVEAHKNLGITLQKLDRLDEAEFSLRKTLELKPDHAEAHYNLAITLQKLNKLEEAEKSFRKSINSFEKVIKINPSDHKAYSNISNIYLRIKEFEKSYNYYVKFLQLESKGVISKAKLENVIPKFAKKMLNQDRIPTFFDNAVEYQLTQKNYSSYDYCELFDKVQTSKENRFILYSERNKNNSNI